MRWNMVVSVCVSTVAEWSKCEELRLGARADEVFRAVGLGLCLTVSVVCLDTHTLHSSPTHRATTSTITCTRWSCRIHSVDGERGRRREILKTSTLLLEPSNYWMIWVYLHSVGPEQDTWGIFSWMARETKQPILPLCPPSVPHTRIPLTHSRSAIHP